MLHREHGSALGYFLAALLGAIVGGMLVVHFLPRQRAVAFDAPAIRQTSAMPAAGTPGGVTDAVRRAGPAVVSISTRVLRQQSGMPDLFRDFFGDSGPVVPQQGQGSGMIIDAAKGYVLTNAHVVQDARSITVTLPDKRSFEGRVVGADRQSDIAVVQIKGRDLPQVPLAADQPPIGSWVVAIGNPFGFANTVTVGVISATEREIPRDDGPPLERMIQTDAAINPGNSGGPLCNLQGEVVGINTAILANAQGLGFAISSAHARTVAQQLIEQGKVVRPWIGVAMAPVSDELKDYYGLPRKQDGVIIASVLPDSPADKAGLKRGDLLVEVNHIVVKTPEDVRNEVQKHKIGESVNILIQRGGQSLVRKIRTAEAPAGVR